MKPSILFIHGAWLNSLCWEKFMPYFQRQGYECLAPNWPGKDKPIEEQRLHPSAALAGLGIQEITGHYEKIIRNLERPPFLIGHSFGGLIVQMLLDRGLGEAGVALHSAPPKGISPLYWSALRSNWQVLSTPKGWKKIIYLPFSDFEYAFVHGLTADERKAAYERYVVPDSGRIFFQAATAPFHQATKVNFKNDERVPLLLIGGRQDRICPAVQIRQNYRKYSKALARTDYKEFNHSHWVLAESGWDEVARFVDEWLDPLKP